MHTHIHTVKRSQCPKRCGDMIPTPIHMHMHTPREHTMHPHAHAHAHTTRTHHAPTRTCTCARTRTCAHTCTHTHTHIVQRIPDVFLIIYGAYHLASYMHWQLCHKMAMHFMWCVKCGIFLKTGTSCYLLRAPCGVYVLER